MSANFCIDGFGPLDLESPTSVEEVGRLVRRAATTNTAVYPVGGETTLHLGNPPSRPGCAVRLTQLNRVIDYPARDMTITVQAGITIARLGEILASENQRLPIDVPQADKATLGGILATNTSGPRRYGYGTLRDYVLGMSVINDEGQEVKSGGRVVKNVAGYDLPKLFVGSLGTLGIITQVTLKLRPRAEQRALVLLSSEAEQIDQALQAISTSRTRPVCVDLLNPAAATAITKRESATWIVAVGYEGQAQTVFWQMNQLVNEMKKVSHIELRLGSSASPICDALVEFTNQLSPGMTLKANILAHAVADFAARVECLAPVLLHAHAGNGIVRGHLDARLALTQVFQIVEQWRAAAKDAGGQVVIERCPSEWKKTLSVWGPGRGDIQLMKTVKDRLDPRAVFNPGRFLDSI